MRGAFKHGTDVSDMVNLNGILELSAPQASGVSRASVFLRPPVLSITCTTETWESMYREVALDVTVQKANRVTARVSQRQHRDPPDRDQDDPSHLSS